MKSLQDSKASPAEGRSQLKLVLEMTNKKHRTQPIRHKKRGRLYPKLRKKSAPRRDQNNSHGGNELGETIRGWSENTWKRQSNKRRHNVPLGKDLAGKQEFGAKQEGTEPQWDKQRRRKTDDGARTRGDDDEKAPPCSLTRGKQNWGAQIGTKTETSACLQGSHRYFLRKTSCILSMLQHR